MSGEAAATRERQSFPTRRTSDLFFPMPASPKLSSSDPSLRKRASPKS